MKHYTDNGIAYKIHPKKHAENSHLPHPQKFSNASKRRWHVARKNGCLGEQIDRRFGLPYNRQDALDAVQRMKGNLQ